MSGFRPALATATCSVTIDGEPHEVPGDTTAAGALLLAGRLAFGPHPVTGEPEGPWCLIGVCFGCLAEIDGVPGRQTCLVPVCQGMVIDTRRGPARP